jgi:hypothetical protein
MDTTYSQVWDAMKNAISTTLVRRDVDGAFIPNDPTNMDYIAYQAWLVEGNTLKPYDDLKG